MKNLLKYTLATSVIAVSMFAGNANAGLFSSCTAGLGATKKPTPAQIKKMNECATEEGDNNPNFIKAMAANSNCADGNVTAGLEDGCAAAIEHNQLHEQQQEAKKAAQSKTGLVKKKNELTKKVAKDQQIVEVDGTKTEKDQATLDADQAALDALNNPPADDAQ